MNMNQRQALSLGLIGKKHEHSYRATLSVEASTRECQGKTLDVVEVEVSDPWSVTPYTIFPGGAVYNDTGEFRNDLTHNPQPQQQPLRPRVRSDER